MAETFMMIAVALDGGDVGNSNDFVRLTPPSPSGKKILLQYVVMYI